MAVPAGPPMDLGALIGREAAATPRLPGNHVRRAHHELRRPARPDRYAGRRACRSGVGGDRVAYLGLNDPMFLITLFAAPDRRCSLNCRLTAAELGYILT